MTARERALLLDVIDRQDRALMEKCDKLREYAERARRGEIHVQHFANAVRKIADEIARTK
jgi:hypothetical protein